MSPDDAVTVWLGQLQAGEAAPARCSTATSPAWSGWPAPKLRNAPRRAADEEDVALSAFDSFCRTAGAGRFPDLADECGRLLAALGDGELRRVALLRMDGHSVDEAAAVGCAPRSVKRKLQLICATWEREANHDPD